MQTQFKTLIYFLVVIMMGLTVSSAASAEWPDYPDTCSATYYYDVALNSSVNGYIRPRDKDVFRITVPSAGTLTIYSSSVLPMDPNGKLMGSSCNKIAEHDDIDKNGSPPNYDFRIVKDVVAGYYWIEVSHDSYWWGQGSYTLYVDFDSATANTITASAGAGGSIAHVGAR